MSKNLTKRQIDFLLLLDNYEKDIFTLEEIREELGDQADDASELVENLADKGILSRIERGKYCRHDFRDEKVIGSHLVADGAVSYWSALHHYGLTEQFPNSVFVQTTKGKRDKTVFGVYYKFIKIAESKRAGVVQEGYGNHSFRITTLEKTLADCFDLPQYSGGYAELLRAFVQAPVHSPQLIAACGAIHNLAATKRMGFLAELSGREELREFVQYAESQVNRRYSPFDPAGEEEGEFVNRWKLRLNISKKDILGIIGNQP